MARSVWKGPFVEEANKKISFDLMYDKNNSLYKKIKIEQTRKETSNN